MSTQPYARITGWDALKTEQQNLLLRIRTWLIDEQGLTPVRADEDGMAQAVACSEIVRADSVYTSDEDQGSDPYLFIEADDPEHWRTKYEALLDPLRKVYDDCDGRGLLTALLCWAIGFPMYNLRACMVSSETDGYIAKQKGRSRRIDHYVLKAWSATQRVWRWLGDTWDDARENKCPPCAERDHVSMLEKTFCLDDGTRPGWDLPEGQSELDFEIFKLQADGRKVPNRRAFAATAGRPLPADSNDVVCAGQYDLKEI